MIQRNSPTIRREESIEEYSPPPLSGEYTHDTSPPSQQQMQQHINYEQHPKDQQPPVKKSRGRPTKQYWTHEWSDHATEALIELWSEKEELYNKQHPLFYVKENKDRAVEEIRDSLRDRGFEVTCNNILLLCSLHLHAHHLAAATFFSTISSHSCHRVSIVQIYLPSIVTNLTNHVHHSPLL